MTDGSINQQASFSTAIPCSSGRASPRPRERDGPGGRREAVLLLRLPQQVPERRVAEVRQLHHEPPRAAPAAFHAHRHVPRRHRGAGARGGGLRCGGGAGPPPAHGAAQPDERRDRDHDLAHA
ncbi:hypothetical protein SETIT_3G026700v2 [Setaria italica]|uniref:Uncharacterized protein n=1 Tax=Setaria italica TaxID=4555 RepID=A0A368QB32_SETIT|nr:hypothetical protein SETIT_3G026700v2 [Setaria italica]